MPLDRYKWSWHIPSRFSLIGVKITTKFPRTFPDPKHGWEISWMRNNIEKGFTQDFIFDISTNLTLFSDKKCGKTRFNDEEIVRDWRRRKRRIKKKRKNSVAGFWKNQIENSTIPSPKSSKPCLIRQILKKRGKKEREIEGRKSRKVWFGRGRKRKISKIYGLWIFKSEPERSAQTE